MRIDWVLNVRGYGTSGTLLIGLTKQAYEAFLDPSGFYFPKAKFLRCNLDIPESGS